ncbi:MAG: hypothetical protein HW421_2205 [Ignavibacteria bacterium]|nr:hypothetical protein [Ignavibacteria bacterium]
MELTKINNDYIDLLINKSKDNNSISKLSDTNRKSLIEMIKYLSLLNKDDKIDSDQFNELILLACANYIENEIELRVNKLINNKFLYHFNKIF